MTGLAKPPQPTAPLHHQGMGSVPGSRNDTPKPVPPQHSPPPSHPPVKGY